MVRGEGSLSFSTQVQFISSALHFHYKFHRYLKSDQLNITLTFYVIIMQYVHQMTKKVEGGGGGGTAPIHPLLHIYMCVPGD